MKISIIIPVYNVEKYIVKCVKSLLAQNFDNYEIIVVDDGSPDNSIKVLQEAVDDDRITIIRQENGGLSAARNSGLKMVKGEYVWFFDSDDWADNNCLTDIASHLRGCDVLCFDSHYNDTDESSSVVANHNILTAGRELSMCDISYPVQYYIYKRSFLQDNNLQFESGLIHEDTLFTPMALYLAGEVACYRKPVYHHYARSGSITHTVNPKRCYDLMKIVEKHSEFLRSKVRKEDRLLWGNHIANSINAMMGLSLQCERQVQEDVNSFVKEHRAVTANLIHSRKRPSRLLGYALRVLPFAPMSIYKFLFRFRYWQADKRKKL